MNIPCVHYTMLLAICGLVVLDLAATTAAAADSDGANIPGTEYTRKADVIYARKHGVALTMDVILPPKPNGAAVIWAVSSGFNSHHAWIEGPQFATNMSIVHGEADKLVPLFQASRMIDKLEAAGVKAELVVARGKGHGWADMWTNEMRHISDWFDVHLAARK